MRTTDLVRELGKPGYVNYNLKRTRTGESYDEVWVYKFHEGLYIPLIYEQSYGFTFYINNSIVINAEGG